MTEKPTCLTDQTIGFLRALKANNTRDWFAKNKADFDALVKGPATALAENLGAALSDLTGQQHKAKLFRVHRDVRFSKDKTPYNAHVHIACSNPDLPHGPMWFWGLGTEKLSLGMGVFGFDKSALARFRDHIASDAGGDFAAQVQAGRDAGLRISEPALKRVPAPFDRDHPRGDLLRMKGFGVWIDHADVARALGPDVVPLAVQDFQKLVPLHRSLSGALGTTA